MLVNMSSFRNLPVTDVSYLHRLDQKNNLESKGNKVDIARYTLKSDTPAYMPTVGNAGCIYSTMQYMRKLFNLGLLEMQEKFELEIVSFWSNKAGKHVVDYA